MSGFNEVTLLGYIRGSIKVDAWTSPTGETRAKARFLLAVRRRNGSYDHVPIVVWGKQASNLAQYCEKGSRVGVQGHIRSEFYRPTGADKDKMNTQVVADSITYLTAPPAGDPPPAGAPVSQSKRRAEAA